MRRRCYDGVELHVSPICVRSCAMPCSSFTACPRSTPCDSGMSGAPPRVMPRAARRASSWRTTAGARRRGSAGPCRRHSVPPTAAGRRPPVLVVLTPAHLRPPPTCRPPRKTSLLCDGKDAGLRRVIALPTTRRRASTPQSRRRCGRVPAQMGPVPAQMCQSRRRCGPVGLRGPAGTVPIGLRACDRTAACLAAVRVLGIRVRVLGIRPRVLGIRARV
jgi:hypothetical protein